MLKLDELEKRLDKALETETFDYLKENINMNNVEIRDYSKYCSNVTLRSDIYSYTRLSLKNLPMVGDYIELEDGSHFLVNSRMFIKDSEIDIVLKGTFSH